MFQSAPLTKARGDAALAHAEGPPQRFNPLPSQKQGETCLIIAGLVEMICFNPLPSQKQGETRLWSVLASLVGMFQSAPLTKARGDNTFG